MENYRGDFLGRYGHPNIIVPAGSAHRAGAEWILDDLEEQIRTGTVFIPGDTAQIGWMTVTLSATNDGELEVLEPEFGSMPVSWVRGANNTIRDLTIQKEVCDQVGVGVDYPSMRQSAVISPNFMTHNQGFELSRDEQSGNDSGWVFREPGYSGSEATLSSLYQVAIAVPAVIPFLALPAGSIVTRSGAGLEVSTERSRISSAENEFLSRLQGSAYFSA